MKVISIYIKYNSGLFIVGPALEAFVTMAAMM